MKATSFRYLLKEGVCNLWKNRVMSLTSIGVLTTCLLIVGAAYLITINVTSMVKYVESQSEMSVFMVRDADEATVQAAKAAIERNDAIASVEYISKAEGFAHMQESMGDAGSLVEDIRELNPIPDTFNVKIKDIEQTAEIKDQLAEIAGVETVTASVEVADTLTSVQNIATTLGGVIILALGIISLVIISNTIRATIFTRRKEINIMKFVGATNSFIRIPFLVEGFMLGLISAGISFFAIWGGYSYLLGEIAQDATSFLQSVFANIIPFEELAANMAMFFGLTGTVLGTLGSAISIRNHVKV